MRFLNIPTFVSENVCSGNGHIQNMPWNQYSKPHIPTFSITIKIVLEPTSESSWFRNQKPGYLKGWRLTGFIVHPLAFLVRQYDVENKENKSQNQGFSISFPGKHQYSEATTVFESETVPEFPPTFDH